MRSSEREESLCGPSLLPTQHDASELLSVLLDKLASLGGVWADLRAATTGSITDTIQCAVCGFQRSRSDDLCGLALAVPRAEGADTSGIKPPTPSSAAAAAAGAGASPAPRLPPPVPLMSCLAAHFAPERLEGSDCWRGCDVCAGTPVPATKRLGLSRVPDVLPIALKRYAFDAATGRYVKVDDAVGVPLSLSLDALVEGDGARPAPPHELRAVLLHAGSTAARGHYVVLIRVEGGGSDVPPTASSSSQQQQWLLANDSGVVRLSDAEVAAVLEPGLSQAPQAPLDGALPEPVGPRVRRSPIPTGATPYLLVYARVNATASEAAAAALPEGPSALPLLLLPEASPAPEVTRLLAAAGLSDASLEAQRDYAVGMGAVSLPRPVVERVAAENLEWLRLCAAYRARQRVVRLSVHPSWWPQPSPGAPPPVAPATGSDPTAPASPARPPASVELYLPCSLSVREAAAACLDAVAAAEAGAEHPSASQRRAPRAPELTRLRLFHPATGAAADTYSRPDLQAQPLSALGWGASAALQLEAHETAWGPSAGAAAAAAVAWEEFDPRALPLTLLRWSPELVEACRAAVEPPAQRQQHEGEADMAAAFGVLALQAAGRVTLPGAPVPTVESLQAAITTNAAVAVPLLAQVRRRKGASRRCEKEEEGEPPALLCLRRRRCSSSLEAWTSSETSALLPAGDRRCRRRWRVASPSSSRLTLPPHHPLAQGAHWWGHWRGPVSTQATPLSSLRPGTPPPHLRAKARC